MPDEERIAAAVEVLRAGGLVAFPTETVYGLGADARNEDAVRRIFAVKGRPPGHPLIVHLPSPASLDDWCDAGSATRAEAARRLRDVFWPGPLTMIVPRSHLVPDAVTGGRATVGLRVPGHPVALALLRMFGSGIAAPSANRFGRVSPTTARDVEADLGEQVDLVLDGGPCDVGIESTIVDLTSGQIEVVRPGAISAEQLSVVLDEPVVHWSGAREVAAPGTSAVHYAPSARVVLVEDEQQIAAPIDDALVRGQHVGVLAPTHLDLPDDVTELEPAGDAGHYAHELFARLRQADRLGLSVLVVVPPVDEGIGRAVRDRLQRAAAAGDGASMGGT